MYIIIYRCEYWYIYIYIHPYTFMCSSRTICCERMEAWEVFLHRSPWKQTWMEQELIFNITRDPTRLHSKQSIIVVVLKKKRSDHPVSPTGSPGYIDIFGCHTIKYAFIQNPSSIKSPAKLRWPWPHKALIWGKRNKLWLFHQAPTNRNIGASWGVQKGNLCPSQIHPSCDQDATCSKLRNKKSSYLASPKSFFWLDFANKKSGGWEDSNNFNFWGWTWNKGSFWVTCIQYNCNIHILRQQLFNLHIYKFKVI